MLSALLLCLVLVSIHLIFAQEDVGDKEYPAFYVCEASNPSFLGVYIAGRERQDNAPVFSNENDMSFFRNKGFWYLGNLGPWPPETHYRCVEAEGCNYEMDMPPTSLEGAWKGSKKYNDGNAPRISKDPCNTASFEEL
jgi:hypothetical protein